MQVSIILAHPDPSSFNHAIANAAARKLNEGGHEVHFHDLYAENFDPLLPKEELAKDAALPEAIAAHCREIGSIDGLVVVHPNWWGQPPAILKGWVDRVVRPGVAYEFLEGDSGDGVPVGLLKAETAVVLNTSNTQAEREIAVFGDPLETLWRRCVFGLCGVHKVYRETFAPVITSTRDQRRQWLGRVEDIIALAFPRLSRSASGMV
jgi:putative NADPH-quinone reductase